MKNTLFDFLTPDAAQRLNVTPANNVSDTIQNILKDARKIDRPGTGDNARTVIEHEKHCVVYWPSRRIIRLFDENGQVFGFDYARDKKSPRAVATIKGIEQAIIAAIPRIELRMRVDNAPATLAEFRAANRLKNWAKLRTVVHG
ncbi:MAG: hypothetical protein LBR41_02655 [Rickettsiales bacterium]|jgi:hypothetical protein|nr:hypothetical protein [Rickettsiales bacterium]